MAADPPALCLDLTRLTRRLWRGPLTGIDRVERAWLWHLAGMASPPVFGLVRTSLGFVLLDRSGLQALARLADTAGTPAPTSRDTFSWLRRLRSGSAQPGEAAVSALALARTPRFGLGRILRRHLPPGTCYLNTGHSNLRPRALKAWSRVKGARIAVLVHDTIPLDHPEWQRPGMAGDFRRRLQAVSAHADRVLYVSQHSRTLAEAHLARMGRVPPGSVALLGVEPAAPDPAALPPGLPPPGPYFVALGTIEPRKDHALLLDVWDELARRPGPDTGPEPEPAPELLIIGRRGWNNEAVFRRLDAMRNQPKPRVRELSGLDDGAVAALLARARALLMPSRAEGYGLPVIEALTMGTPVIATDLPVYRETAGELPVYLPAGDLYSWTETILRFSTKDRPDAATLTAPNWDEHFKRVLNSL